MGKLRRVLKQVCLLHKEELDFLRGEKERLEAERDEWRGKALDADSANERLHAAMNSGSITINSQGVSAISNGETWTYKAFDLPESGTIQDILIEKNTGLEMAVAILTADRDNLKEAKAKVEYEAQNFAKDRDEWKNAYDVLKVDCGPIEITRLPDRCEDCEWKELAEKRSAELAEARLELAQQSGGLLPSGLMLCESELNETRRELESWQSAAERDAKRIESLQKSLATAHETIRAQVEMIRAKAERADFLESELDRFDALGIERLKAEMDKADRLKAELEEARAAFISVTGYKDRVRAVVGNLVKVASSE